MSRGHSANVSTLRQSSPILLGDVSSSPTSFDSLHRNDIENTCWFCRETFQSPLIEEGKKFHLSNEGSLLNISVGTVGGAFSGTNSRYV